VPEFISRVPAIEEPDAREREELIEVTPEPETSFERIPERLRVPVLVIVPPIFSAEEVIVEELETLPEIAELLVKVPELETLPVIPELLVNEPPVTETLEVIPVPLLVKVPELWVIRD